MRRFANFMLDMAAAIFGISGVIIGGYFIYWLLTSPTLKAMIFSVKPSCC